MDAIGTRRFADARAVSWVRRHWGLTVAVVVPVVTVATIVIPLIADAAVRTSSVSTLQVEGVGVVGNDPAGLDSAQVITARSASTVGLGAVEIVNAATAGSNRDWLVRSDAPFDTFPLGAEPGQQGACSPSQISWLEQWGRRKRGEVWNGYLTLSNVASTGASMSLSNIHSVGTFTTPAVPEASVTCGGGIGAGSNIIVITQELGTDEPAALGASYFGQPEGSPAVINVAPGEFIQLYVNFTRSTDVISDFTGSLVGDVRVGDEVTRVTLFDPFTRIGKPEITTTSLQIADQLYCGPKPYFEECDMPKFIAQLQADPGLHR